LQVAGGSVSEVLPPKALKQMDVSSAFNAVLQPEVQKKQRFGFMRRLGGLACKAGQLAGGAVGKVAGATGQVGAAGLASISTAWTRAAARAG
jgi:hypothetical protein